MASTELQLETNLRQKDNWLRWNPGSKGGRKKIRFQKQKQKLNCKLYSSISKLGSDFLICEQFFFSKFILEVDFSSKLYGLKTEIEVRMGKKRSFSLEKSDKVRRKLEE